MPRATILGRFGPDLRQDLRPSKLAHGADARGLEAGAHARKLGLGSAQLRQLTDEMFKYDIDFDSDLDENDRFSVVVDQTWKDGKLVDTGPVLAATITADGKLFSGFLFERDGKPGYLAHLPRIEGYLARNLNHPALTHLRLWHEAHLPHLVPKAGGEPAEGG